MNQFIHKFYILKRSKTWFLGFLFCFILAGCAVVGGGPTGGSRDLTPPKVVKSIPANRSVYFKDKKIVISFDEFIDLGNVFQEVIISPTLKKMPEILVDRKDLVINFKGIDLLPNTTYSIQFGKAIKDYNEGNVLRNYRYIFSTGAYLDSLSVSGRGIEGLTHAPAIGYKVEIYKAGFDSGIYKAKPLYYSRCDSFGRFKIDYLPKGAYELYILDDKNDNYFVDDGEDIGFPASAIKLDSSLNIKDSICAFPYAPAAPLIKSGQYANHILQLKLEHPIDTFNLKMMGSILNAPFKKMESTRDSFTVWITDNYKSVEVLLYNKDNNLDTIVKADTAIKVPKFTVRFATSPDYANYYDAPAVLISNKPVLQIDLSKVKFYQDTVVLKGLGYRFLDSSRTLIGLIYPYEDNKNYRFKLQPGSVTSIFNETNGKFDTISGTMVAPGLKNFGTFEMNVVPDGGSYIFQLVNESGQVVFYKNVPRETLVKIPFVNPGKYRVRLIKDDNKNGRWDGGDLKTRRQPEEVIYYPKVINMKANWEMTGLKFDLNSKPVKKP